MSRDLRLLVFLTCCLVTRVTCDFACLCTYAVETEVHAMKDAASTLLGYMYEFDCKELYAMAASDNTWTAITFQHQVGYIQKTSTDLIQNCPGNPDAADIVTSTSATYSTSMQPDPTTPLPNTQAPTTAKITSQAPTTAQPTTSAPITTLQTSQAPTSTQPTTPTPTTPSSIPAVSSTAIPTTSLPKPHAPTTDLPTTAIPSKAVLTTDLPTTAAPTTALPTTAIPFIAVPTTAVPYNAAPTTALPTTAIPSTVVPTTAVPSTAAPTTDLPTAAIQSNGAPTTSVPTNTAPTAALPTTAIPSTAVPTTAVPATLAPTTVLPTTTRPSTAAPTKATPTYKCPINVATNAMLHGGLVTVHGDSCFEIVPQPMTWNDAERHCNVNGGHLAYITSQAEEDFIMSFGYKSGFRHSVWIGLSDQGKEEHWTWTSGYRFTWSNWFQYRFNSQTHYSENCVALVPDIHVTYFIHTYGKWDDLRCGVFNPSLCRYDAHPIQRVTTTAHVPHGLEEFWANVAHALIG